MKQYSKICIHLVFCLQLFGHVIPGKVATTPNPPLLYSTMKDIRLMNSSRANKITNTILQRNFSEGSILDYHFEQKKICWGDHVLENIECVEYDGVETKNKVEILTGVLTPVGLACDWFTNKLYWTDSELNRIEVATMEGKYRKVLFWTDIDQPRAIALAPMKGLMFWTDWGEIPKIERASMDGNPTTRTTIVSTNIFWPNGITIDFENELLYWVDGKLQFIESMTYDGKNRTVISNSTFTYPYALTMFDTKLYWTDWKTWSIHYFDLKTNLSEKLHRIEDIAPMDIHVYDKRRQPQQSHPCEHNNGGCSHLCLLSPLGPGYSCACPSGIKLKTNLTCNSDPQELLVLARRTDISLIYLDSPEFSQKVLALNDIKFAIAVDYDPAEGFLYWSDDEVKKIQRVRLDGSDQQDVITTEIQHPDGIAIDWVSRNMYWTDAGTDRVEVCRLTGRFRRVVISDNLMKPRAIAVAPELGWLFWSDWHEKNTKIERSNLDGSERIVVIGTGLVWPNGIALDLVNQKLYWGDGKTDKIEYANMDGSDRRVLISDVVPHVFGFTLMGDFLYWTDWQRRAIDRAHKNSGGQREVILDQIPNVMGLKAIQMGAVSGTNPCSLNNGDCTHFCFYRHNKTVVCACQLGHELTKDRRTCVKPDTFLLYTKNHKIGIIGIEHENNEMSVPVSGIQHASAIDYDVNTNRIYWSDSSLRVIMRAFVNGSDPRRVIELGLASPEGIAIDWLGLNIYWTDPLAHRIEVARLHGTSRRTLLWEGKVYDPHSIVLDPTNGYMYWSEWEPHAIKKAAMDGSNSRKLTSTKAHGSSLSLDYNSRRLYWIENRSPAIILSSDLDGNDRKIIVEDGIFRPIGLTVYGDFIYWNEDVTGHIIKANKLDGSKRQVIHQLQDNITDLVVYHPKHHGTNQCAISNGGCSHLCLALPSELPGEPANYTCACPTHYSLVNKECIAPKNFMIYAQKNLTYRILPSPTGCLEAVLPIQGLKGLRSIDYDPIDNFLYWIEGKSQTIKRAEVSGLYPSVVIHGNVDLQPFDLAVDALGRLLFWTCAAQNVINVTRLDNTVTLGVVVQKDNESPRLLAIHPTKRLLFYTDVGSARQLVRTRLDGSHRLVITRDADIAAIAVDSENDWIVWAQGQSIYASNIEGENAHILVNESQPRITQLTVLSGWLYWIERESLQRVELLSGNFSDPLSLQASHIVDIISVSKPDLNHSCYQLPHRKCSHLCILHGNSAACACPKGNVLKDDKRTCTTLLNCGPDRFMCASATDNKDCIPLRWRCDRQEDCLDGSDELECPDCQPNQFKCQDGHCITQSQVCDGIAHCTDKSDEENCCKGFLCPNTEVCLPSGLVCDKIDHCADGSDEHQSLCNTSANKVKETSDGMMVLIIVAVSALFVAFAVVFYCLLKKIRSNEDLQTRSENSQSPMQPEPLLKGHKIKKGIPDVVRMSMINRSETSSYDRDHITGASSSTNGSSLNGYPREPLNPPPSEVTSRGSSPSSRWRPYRHYRAIYLPPPPTPCSTDVCDESDSNYYLVRNRYEGGPYPPPPTPRSHCHSESCPPSPSSRSSTYFSPLPPPPSPVASPSRRYDS